MCYDISCKLNGSHPAKWNLSALNGGDHEVGIGDLYDVWSFPCVQNEPIDL